MVRRVSLSLRLSLVLVSWLGCAGDGKDAPQADHAQIQLDEAWQRADVTPVTSVF